MGSKQPCPHCGHEVNVGASFCAACGTRMGVGTTPATPADTARASASTGTRPTVPLVAHGLRGEAATRVLKSTLPNVPRGESLAGGRLRVVTVLGEWAQGYRYLAREDHDRLCAQCGKLNRAEDAYGDGGMESASFCERCGRSLEERHFLVLETTANEPAETARDLLNLPLRRDDLVNLVELIDASQGDGAPRWSLLFDPVDPDLVEGEGEAAQTVAEILRAEMARTAGEMQAMDALFRRVRAIAEVLDALAQQGVTLSGISARSVLIAGAKVRLAGLETATIARDGARAASVAAHNAALARLVLELAAGRTLPPPLMAELERAARDPANAHVSTVQRCDELAALCRRELQRRHSLETVVGRATNLGKVREINEDSLLVVQTEQFHNGERWLLRLFAVADGMGGHAAGELASRCAINALADEALSCFRKAAQDGGTSQELDTAALLRGACLAAARETHALSSRQGQDPGTTLVSLLAEGARACVANIGDSRAYHLRARSLRQVSVDHSLAELLISRNGYSRAEALAHPSANQIYRSLGQKQQVEVDLFTLDLEADDWIVLCSDGLSGLVNDETIAQICSASPHPQTACDALVRAANQAGGHDNITVICVRFVAAAVSGDN